MEEQRKSHRPSRGLADEDLGLLLFKQPFVQQVLGGNHLVLHLLIYRKALDKVQNQCSVRRLCHAEGHLCHIKISP